MSVLRIKSFGNKLLLVMLLMSGAAAVFVCTSLVIRQIGQVRESAIEELETHGDIIRIHSVAALRFNDPAAGTETLAALEAVPDVQRAEIVHPDGTLFAAYQNSNERVVVSHSDVHGYQYAGSMLILSRPIEHGGDSLGTLHLYYDMRPTYAAIRSDIAVAGAMAIAAMGLSLVLGLHLRKALSQPIRQLVGVTRVVVDEHDYTQRAVHHRYDDLGEVMNGFNSMLDTIELRQAQLQKAHDELEQRVRERTAELESATASAEAANRAKTDFLANMSHEIRTPMTAILGYSEMLQDPEHSPSHRLECIQTIRRNGNHLLGLINDILDISKIEAGRMSVERCPCSLVGLIADVASLIRLRAGEKGLQFRVGYATTIPETINTDPTRLRQILMNLLGNAVKFTQQGSVTLTVQVYPGDEANTDEHFIRFDVQDSGVGLSPEQIDRLFKPFAQADESVTRRFGGTGLGLAISRQLTLLLGGDISVRSEPGLGTTFSATVRTGSLRDTRMFEGTSEIEAEVRSHASTSDADNAPLPAIHGRVLLAEDGYDNQRLIRGILTAAGADVTVAENGRAACDAIAEAEQRREPFDLVFMDMQMPEMDGYTATSTLRSQGRNLPIIALTAHALTGDRVRCLQAGCDEYLTKPIDRRRLVQTAARYLKTSEGSSVTSVVSPSPAQPSAVISNRTKSHLKDASGLRSEWADDPTMTDLIQEFVSALPERIHELERALTEGDLNALAVLAHKLKGAGGGYGYPSITEVARSLERFARQDQGLDAIRTGIRELQILCEQAKTGLDASTSRSEEQTS